MQTRVSQNMFTQSTKPPMSIMSSSNQRRGIFKNVVFLFNVQKKVFDKETIDAMEEKRKANIVEANAEAAAYYAALANRVDDKITIGSEDWKIIVR